MTPLAFQNYCSITIDIQSPPIPNVITTLVAMINNVLRKCFTKGEYKIFFYAMVLRNFPLRMDRELILHAIDVGPLQTFDLSWNYDNGFDFVYDVFLTFSQFFVSKICYVFF